MVPKLVEIVWLNLVWMVECSVNFVNFANYAYGIVESAGSIADEWQMFFVVVLTLHFEFECAVEFLLAEAVDIHFGICSLFTFKK